MSEQVIFSTEDVEELQRLIKVLALPTGWRLKTISAVLESDSPETTDRLLQVLSVSDGDHSSGWRVINRYTLAVLDYGPRTEAVWDVRAVRVEIHSVPGGTVVGYLIAGQRITQMDHVRQENGELWIKHNGIVPPGWSLVKDGNLTQRDPITGLPTDAPAPAPTPQPVPNPLPPPQWWEKLALPFVAVNITPKSVINMYDKPAGKVARGMAVDWDMKVTKRQRDKTDLALGWLRVSEQPEYWVKSTVCKLKGG